MATATTALASITIQVKDRDATEPRAVEVPTAWQGQALAVHRAYVGVDHPCADAQGLSALAGSFKVTHMATGMGTLGAAQLTKTAAIRLAKLWDARFAADIRSGADATSWRYRNTWTQDVKRSILGITELDGPTLPDHPTAGDVTRAMTAAITGEPVEALDDDDMNAQYPAAGVVPAHKLRTTPEGITQYLYRGNWEDIPTMAEVEEWISDSICPTPDGDEVEPDHPASWLSILGLI